MKKTTLFNTSNQLQIETATLQKHHQYYPSCEVERYADLIRGANDEQESISLVEELFRLAGIYNTCMFFESILMGSDDNMQINTAFAL